MAPLLLGPPPSSHGFNGIRGQGQGCGQAKEICTGPRLRAAVSSPEHVSPHLHASGQLLRVNMPAQDLAEATVSGGEHCLTQSTHLALHPQMGVTVLPQTAPEGDLSFAAH